MDKAKYVFEKLAIGPVVSISNSPKTESWGFYASPKNLKKPGMKLVVGLRGNPADLVAGKGEGLKRGVIYGNQGKGTLPWTKKTDVKTHELTHYLRDKKDKWSSKKYSSSKLARGVEEFAALKRGGENVFRATQGGIASVAGRKSVITKLLKFIK
jgi:hypothetical protein